MGGTFSTGLDNDELVDNLIISGYIRSTNIEKVFRAVDRGHYFLSSYRRNAYNDFAWKHGNLHISAPCIYCEVLENLALEPGQSFLNLGSGTGYLNTLAGLLLSQNGTNHGIELNEECVKYSYDRLEEFKQKSLALDEFDFCEPHFVQGNCLNTVMGRRYDKVYCGALCPETHEAFIKDYVKVGGILVMPYKDHLLRAQRIDENNWVEKSTLRVSFTKLAVPTLNEETSHLPNCNPLSLQELCRGKIRRQFRQNIWKEHSADLESHKPIVPANFRMPRTGLGTLGQFPITYESDEFPSDEDDDLVQTRYMLNVDMSHGYFSNGFRLLQETITRNNENLQTIREYDDDDDDESMNSEEEIQDDSNVIKSMDVEKGDSGSTSDSAREKSESYKTDSEEKVDSGSACNHESPRRRARRKVIRKEITRTNDSNGDSPLCPGSYENMSENDSDEDNDEPPAQKKKVTRQFKVNSGSVENKSNTVYVQESSSSDSDLNEPPFKKMPSPSKKTGDKLVKPVGESSISGHFVDSNAFSSYMKEKIHQLPLPTSLKLYINYNRNL